MKTLVLIPARSGSKGIPGKNIKKLAGKPLIQYTIEAAKAVFPTEDILVSTDAKEISKVAENCGLSVPFLRPADLSTDHSSSHDVIIHALEYMKNQGREYNTLVLLQPTSPFRNGAHIQEALKEFKSEIDMVVSVKESEENPYYTLFEESENGFLKHSKEGNFTRRQDCPSVYTYNGAIYIVNIKSLLEKPMSKFTKVKKYVMSELESIDLDTPLDWDLAELVLEKYLSNRSI